MRMISGEQQPQKDGRFNLSEYWRLLWRKKYFLLIPMTLSLAVAAFGMRFVSPVFRSVALVRVEDQNYLSREVAQLITTTPQQRREAQDQVTLAKMQAEFRRSNFLDELSKTLGVQSNARLIESAKMIQKARLPDLTVEEIVLRQLRGMLGSKFQVELKGPGMFSIACFDNKAETAYLLADAATNVYIETQRKRSLVGLQEAGEFGDEQLAVYKERLEKAELELEHLQKEINTATLQEDAVTDQTLRLAETIKQRLAVRISDLDGDVARTRSNLVKLMGQIPDGESVWGATQYLELKKSVISYRETDVRLELGGRTVNPQSRDETGQQIIETEGDIQRELQRLVSLHYPDIGIDYNPLVVEYFFQLTLLDVYKAVLDKLDSYVFQFRSKLARRPQLETELVRLREQVRTEREMYNSFIRAKTSTQISEAMQNTELGAGIEVMERASRPMRPFAPNKQKIFLLALLFGISLGGAGLLVSEYWDTSFKSVEEIEEKLEIRVLGTIPRADASATWQRARLKKQAAIWVTTSMLVITASLFGFYYYGKTTQRQTFYVPIMMETGAANEQEG